METIINFLRTDLFLLIIACINILLLVGFIITLAKFSSINKKYKSFIKKLGNGKNIDEDLQKYINKVEEVQKHSEEIFKYCRNIDTHMSTCIQKVGIVRYSAFKDTGSDLSFALALLDEKNNGIVLNGIYSREMSNIYAKPVENGKSQYTITAEEQQAIDKAIESSNVYKIK